ncbi:MAG TPA: response regulator transcription factor [Methylophilaceae bacterium]|nr:response regulator transcription factor [Methylophilaceae bacterium]
MRDLFICPRNSLLANWSEAFPDSTVYPSLSAVNGLSKDECVFWLHAGPDAQQWIVASISQIFRDFYNPRIIVLANVPDQSEALLALSQGARGYCHAYSPAELLIEVRTVISHGGIWLGRELLQRLIAVSTGLVGNKSEEVIKTLLLLTEREKEVALEAAKGLSNKEIARMLDITERTVKAHLSSTFERLGIKDRLQLALILNDKSSQ